MNLERCIRQWERTDQSLANMPKGISHWARNGKENTWVLVTTHNVLLGDVLEILLTDELISVHRVMCTQPDSVLRWAERHQPQVVVLEDGLLDEICLTRLAQWQGRGRRRVILVHPQKNVVQIYGELPISLTQSADFIALFESISSQAKGLYKDVEQRN